MPATKAVRERPLVVYFGFDAENYAVINRISAFQHSGAEVLGLTYRRGDFKHGLSPNWENVALGETSRGNYLSRVLVMLRAPKIIWENRGRISEASLFYARNLDMALLALLARFLSGSKAPFVYEVRDVVPALLGNGPRARLLRWLERRVLVRSRILDVSSPGFIDNYFVPVQGHRGEWFLSANKIHAPILRKLSDGPRGDAAAKIGAMKRGRVVIGSFGLFRCVRSLEMLGALSDRLPVLVYLRGSPQAMEMDAFLELLGRHPNMVYDGEYSNPKDLGEIYGAVDVVWGFDFSHAGANSAWLLPRRLYESAYYGVPMLADARTQTGVTVNELGIGWTFEEPLMENLEKFFSGITAEEIERKKAFVSSLPRELFCEEDDTGRLLRAVLGPNFAPRLVEGEPAG